MKIQTGDYVRITRQPDPWEGSGEEPEDALSLIGHIGLVIETDDEWALLRFPWLDSEGVTGQRNVELTALELMSRPPRPLPMSIILESGPGPDEVIIIGNSKFVFKKIE